MFMFVVIAIKVLQEANATSSSTTRENSSNWHRGCAQRLLFWVEICHNICFHTWSVV